MNTYCKLTNQSMQTRNGFQWVLNKEFEIGKKLQNPDKDLCSSSWFHVYNDPILAVLLNPVHANINDPRLFECECGGYCKLDKGLKIGWTKVKLTREIEVPQITLVQKIAFGILGAKRVYKNKDWNKWADDWLDNEDRSSAAARMAANATHAVGYAADAVDYAAAYAAHVAAYPVNAACGVADVAACAAADAALYDVDLNLVMMAHEAMKY